MSAQETLWQFFGRSPWHIRMRLVFWALVGLAAVLLSAWAIRWILFLAPQTKEPPGTVFSPEPLPLYSHTYEMENISIPLVDRRQRRTGYAQFALVLDCPTPDIRKQMELHRAEMLNAIFEVAAQFYIEDFTSERGFKNFKAQLTAHFHTIFKGNGPREISIKDWVLN